eukprot:8969450-Ditylum_brightwellii.AAC.1
MQQVIDAFGRVWREDKNACAKRGYRNLKEIEMGNNITSLIQPRTLQQDWHPWEFVWQTNSDWFYGYMGSLTEPPCYSFAHYRIIDTPNEISAQQLHALKNIILYHQDPGTCSYTSVHNKYGSVARPLQDSRRTWVHRCTCTDFLPDKTRKTTGKRSCRRGQESQWMPNPKDLTPAPGNEFIPAGGSDDDTVRF